MCEFHNQEAWREYIERPRTAAEKEREAENSRLINEYFLKHLPEFSFATLAVLEEYQWDGIHSV